MKWILFQSRVFVQIWQNSLCAVVEHFTCFEKKTRANPFDEYTHKILWGHINTLKLACFAFQLNNSPKTTNWLVCNDRPLGCFVLMISLYVCVFRYLLRLRPCLIFFLPMPIILNVVFLTLVGFMPAALDDDLAGGFFICTGNQNCYHWAVAAPARSCPAATFSRLLPLALALGLLWPALVAIFFRSQPKFSFRPRIRLASISSSLLSTLFQNDTRPEALTTLWQSVTWFEPKYTHNSLSSLTVKVKWFGSRLINLG